MQKRKLAALAGVTLLSAGLLAACGGASSSKSSEASSTYSYVYTEDPASLDYVHYNRAQVGQITTNAVDGLLEYDKYGNLIPSLAEDWKVSKDGLTYTYTLREGVKWYTADGEEYADVTAEDFVTGIKHAADSESEGLYIIQDSIAGLADYVSGKTKDFSTVGVKALDERTVQYTLARPETYWNSKVTMSTLMPINAEFLESKGEDFGKVSPDGILYNGAYFISAMTSKSSIELTKNENYWDADKVKVDNIKWTYYDGQDPESLVKGFTEGNYSNARVFPNSSTYDAVKKQYKDNIYYSMQDSTSYFFIFNVNRTNFNHTAKTSDAEKSATTKALQNKDFRQAIAFAINREDFNAQSVGKDGAKNSLRNLYVPPTFVSAGEKTFGDLVKDKLVSYGDEWSDVNLDDAQDGYYNADKAKAEFAKAKEALAAEGVTFPIHLDVPVDQSSTIAVQQMGSFKQSVEESLGKENVVIDIVQVDTDTFSNLYYIDSAEQADFDLSYAGWGPDYQDPSTYLDTLVTTNGTYIPKFGIDVTKNADVIKKVGLDQYDALIEEASKETSDVAVRYEKYAAAQAWLADSALIIPRNSLGGTPNVSKVVPQTAAFSWVGIKGSDMMKGLEVGTDINKAEDIYKLREKWLEEKTKSNAEAEKELAKHVEE